MSATHIESSRRKPRDADARLSNVFALAGAAALVIVAGTAALLISTNASAPENDRASVEVVGPPADVRVPSRHGTVDWSPVETSRDPSADSIAAF